MKRWMLIALLATHGVRAADADEGIVSVLPCRPTIACTAEIVPGGSLELELGWAQRRASGAPTNSVQALAKISLTDRLQLQVGTNNVLSSQADTMNTLDGAFFGPKVVLLAQGDVVPAVAVSALLSTPTRDGAAAVTHTTDLYLWGYASKDLPWVHADLNVGFNVLSVDDQPAVQELVALSLSRDIGHGVGAMLESYAFWNGGAYAAHDAGVLTGLTYSLAPRVMFDAGFDVSLYRDSRNITLFTGVTFVPYTSVARRPVSTIASR